MVAVVVSFLLTTVYPAKLYFPCGKIDWTIDRLQCFSGDEVRITLTNLGGKDEDTIILGKGVTVWKVTKEDNNEDVYFEILEKDILIKKKDSYTWSWPTRKGSSEEKDKEEFQYLKEGTYRIWRVTNPET